MKTALLLTALLLPFALQPSGCAHQVEVDPDDNDDDDSGPSGSSGQTSASSSSGSGGAGSATSTGTGTGSGTGTGGGSCGNGTVEPGETCDPPATCPVNCNDGDECTTDTLVGAASTCDASCSSAPVTACVADGCCAPSCAPGLDPDCAACGNGVIEPGEECDDGNVDSTDGCVAGCLAAECGDGFVRVGVEQCDDGNLVDGDGCSAACTLGNGTFGPVHTFVGLSSSFYITQFGCSNSGGIPAGDALYFCQHYYAPACTALSWQEGSNSINPMMHSGTNCYSPDPGGLSVPGTSCVGGPCKIGDYGGPLGGLSNIVCSCP